MKLYLDVLGASFIRLMRGLLGIWCALGPLLPLGLLLESHPLLGALGSALLGFVIWGFILSRWKKGSKFMPQMTKDTLILTGLSALTGAVMGVYNAIFNANVHSFYLWPLAAWGCFWLLEVTKAR